MQELKIHIQWKLLQEIGRALQSGTSHYFGQNFTKAFDVKFQNKEGKEENPYQTSWGISTRLIGAVIMAHGDERGLKLPPKLAPIQVRIIPIAMQKEGVIENIEKLKDVLKNEFRVDVDKRDNITPGFKFNECELKGIPLRIEMGPRDIENGECVLVRRDTFEKKTVKLENVKEEVRNLLDEIQSNMYNICKKRLEEKTNYANNLDEFEEKINQNQGYIKAMWCGKEECEDKIKERTGAHSRCIPFEEEHFSDKCVCCGEKADRMVVWGRQY